MGPSHGRCPAQHVESLEPRRLLSYAPFGTVTPVPPADAEWYEGAVAVADNGSFIVVSEAFVGVENNSIGTLTTRAIRYSFDGQQTGTPLTLRTRPFNSITQRQGPVSVSIDADGDAVVAYAIAADDFQVEYYFQRISKTGELSDPVFITQGFISDLSVSMDDGGGFFAGWTRLYDRLVEMRAYDTTGTPRGPTFVAFEDETASFFRDIDIDARADGTGAAFSFTHHRVQPFVLFGRVSTTALIGDIESPDGPIGGSTNHSSIAILSGGSLAVTFLEFSPISGNPHLNLGYLQRYDSDNQPEGDLIALQGEQGLPGVGGIAVDSMSDGGLAVTFRAGNSVYAQRFDPSGAADESGPIRLASTSAIDFVVGDIGTDNNGSTIVLFSERRDATNPSGDPTTAETLQFRRATPQPAAIDKSVLYVLGTNDPDTIEIAARGLSIVASRGTLVRRFNPALVTSVVASGYAGNDLMRNSTLLTSLMDGGEGDDILVGGPSRDKLLGAGGGDHLYGGGAGDLLYGQDGDDFLFGEAGNDTLNGGGGFDVLRGEAGNDLLVGTDTFRDSLYGHEGRDTALADGDDVLRTIEVRQG